MGDKMPARRVVIDLHRHDFPVGLWGGILASAILPWIGDYIWGLLSAGGLGELTGKQNATIFKIMGSLLLAAIWYAGFYYLAYKRKTKSLPITAGFFVELCDNFRGRASGRLNDWHETPCRAIQIYPTGSIAWENVVIAVRRQEYEEHGCVYQLGSGYQGCQPMSSSWRTTDSPRIVGQWVIFTCLTELYARQRSLYLYSETGALPTYFKVRSDQQEEVEIVFDGERYCQPNQN